MQPASLLVLDSTTLLFIAKAVMYGTLALLALAAAGSPFVALVSEAMGVSRRMVFMDKFAQQVTMMGVTLSLSTLPFTAGGYALLASKESLREQLTGPPAMIYAMAFLLSLFLLLDYHFSWNRLKKRKVFHMARGGLACLAAWAALLLLLGMVRTLLLYPEAFAADQTLRSFFWEFGEIPVWSKFWTFYLQLLAWAVAGAAGLGLAFVLSRRDRDDFGRDYYAFAVKHGAKHALWSSAPLLALSLWFGMFLFPEPSLELAGSPLFLGMLVSLGSLVLAMAGWMFVAGSKTPLRHKPTMVCSAALALLSASAEGFCLASLFFRGM